MSGIPILDYSFDHIIPVTLAGVDNIRPAPERDGHVVTLPNRPAGIGDYLCTGDIARTLSNICCPLCGEKLQQLETSGRFLRIIGLELEDETLPLGMSLLQCHDCMQHFTSQDIWA